MNTTIRITPNLVFASLLVVAVIADARAVPQLINFQGRVQVEGADFNGTGAFRFALVSEAGSTTYWSNDGTSTAGSEPSDAVSLTVTNGLYSVLLGNATIPNMTVVPASVFANDDVFLRIWFDDGSNGSQLLTPDQRIAAVGYAMMAANAASVSDGAITSQKIAPGAITTDKLAPNLSVPSILQGGTAVVPGVSISSTKTFDVTFPVPFDGVPATMIPRGARDFEFTGVTATGFSGAVIVLAGNGATVVGPGSGTPNLIILGGRPAIIGGTGFAINARADGSGTWTTESVGTGRDPSVAVIGGKPALSYRSEPLVLKFVINENVDGSGTWNEHLVFSGGTEASSLAEVGGKPAVAFYSQTNVDLRFAINDNADGSGVWTTTVVEELANAASLIELDGRPAMCYGVFAAKDNLVFAINSSADGTGTWTKTVVADAALGPFNTPVAATLTVMAGKPAISYLSPAEELVLATNTEADGSGTWTRATIGPGEGSLAVVDGKLTRAYQDTQHGRVIAQNSKIDGSGTWTVLYSVVGLTGPDRSFSKLIEVDGRPALSALTFDGNRSSLAFWIMPQGPGPDVELDWIAIKP